MKTSAQWKPKMSTKLKVIVFYLYIYTSQDSVSPELSPW